MNELSAWVRKALDSEAALFERHEAFARLVWSFQDMAYACAFAVLGDFQLAEDVAQEAFVCAWQKLDQLRKPEAFPGWFRRIVLTECSRRTRGKRLQLISLDEGADVSSPVAHPQTSLEQNELKNAVLATIERLPQEERMVVVLFYLNEKSQRDISAFLDVPTTTVAKRLYSARLRLRGLIPDEFKESFLARRPSRNRTFAQRVADGLFDEYVGEYRFDLRPELTVSIKREGSRLIGESAGQRNELWAGRNPSMLSTKEFDGKGRFIRDRDGRISHFVYYEFGQEMGVAKKIS